LSPGNDLRRAAVMRAPNPLGQMVNLAGRASSKSWWT